MHDATGPMARERPLRGRFRRLCLGLVLALACLMAWGAPLGRIGLLPVGSQSGLPGTRIEATCQDRQGMYWVACYAGLYNGDGTRFFRVTLPGVPPDTRATALEQDAEGRLWVATALGLFRRTEGRWERLPVGGPPGPNRVGERILMTSDGHGRIWVLGQDRQPRPGGMGNLWLPPRLFHSRPDGKLEPSSLPIVSEGEWWLGPGQGQPLLVRAPKVWILGATGWESLPTLPPPVGTSEVVWAPPVQDGTGHTWILTYFRLFHLAPGMATWEPARLDPRPASRIARLSRLSDGSVWLSATEGIYGIHGGQVSFEPSPSTTSFYESKVLFRDRDGSLWLDRSGLCRLRGRGFWREVSGSEGLPTGEYRTVLEDPGGRLWTAGSAGVFRKEVGAWQPIPGFKDLEYMAFTPEGTLWLGRREDRLYRLDQGRSRAVPVTIPGMDDGDRLGWGPMVRGQEVWIATVRAGLHRARREGGGWRWEQMATPGNPGTPIRSFRIAPDGGLWVRRGSSTFLSRDGVKWQWIPEAEKLVPQTPVAFGGRICITSWSPPDLLEVKEEGGQVRLRSLLDRSRWAPSSFINRSHEDNWGRLWVGTDAGLLLLQTDGQGVAIRRLASEETFPSGTNTSPLYQEKNGRFWFGSSLGLYVFEGSAETPLPPLPAPLLLAASASGKALPLAFHQDVRSGQTLQWDLGFPSPSRVHGSQVEWRYDNGDWQTLSGWTLNLSGLPSGMHAFELRVRTPEGLSPALSLQLDVIPRWWESVWARLGYLLAAGGVAVLLFRWRMARLRMLTRLLADQVAEATTDLREKAVELEQANRHLAHLNDEKNRVLGVAAHDLRSPMGAVDSYAQLLEELEDLAEVREVGGRIRQAAKHQLDLLQELLDTSRIEAGGLDLKPVDLDPLEFVYQLLHVHQTRAATKDQRLVVETSGLLPELRADALRLRQVLDNLISNALKFMPPGGTVTLRLTPGFIEVQDEGPGFTQVDRARLFSRFERLSARPTGGEPSTGLGLSIAKELVEAMGGSITLVSEPGKGACFVVRLPLA